MTDRALLAELNRDVWHAFRRAYAARDVEGFLALHLPELIRAGGRSRDVYGYDAYTERTGEIFAELTRRGDGIAIDFRFTERIAAAGLASERGVFRITTTPAEGEQRVFYGRFHTFARRVDGRWRLAVDYDSDEGGTVDADSFTAGTEIDDLAPFAD